MSVAEYLARELESDVKHEYLGGGVYAMPGPRNQHNLVASNILGSFWAQLRGRDCRAYNSDMKIRIRLFSHVRFYYPDVSVVCRPNPPDDSFQDEPVVVVEVLSESTRRLDEGEKKETYLAIPSLCLYLLVERSPGLSKSTAAPSRGSWTKSTPGAPSRCPRSRPSSGWRMSTRASDSHSEGRNCPPAPRGGSTTPEDRGGPLPGLKPE